MKENQKPDYIEDEKKEAFTSVNKDGSLYFEGVFEDRKFNRKEAFKLMKVLNKIFESDVKSP